MTHFLKNGNTFKQYADGVLDIHEKLPVGNYIIKQDPFGNFFLEQVDNFSFTTKRYGDNVKNTERVIQTFLSRDNCTGVMLAGTKGSGKSLLAKCISIRGAELSIPTIIINSPYHGDNFNRFIQEIEQECIILFDEFEKVYDRDSQEAILTLLDGVFPSKKLFVLTCNDKWRVDQHMRNRPGRIFYMFDFSGLSIEFIEEYCQDNLVNKSHIDTIGKISSLFAEFNFDMLKALVEEMNRYDESPQEALKILNVKAEYEESNSSFNVKLVIDNFVVNNEDIYGNGWTGNPLKDNVRLEYKQFFETVSTSDSSEYDDDSWEWATIKFEVGDLKQVDSKKGTFTFANKSGQIVTLTKIIPKSFNYYDAF